MFVDNGQRHVMMQYFEKLYGVFEHAQNAQIQPSGHTTLKWRRINVDATWSRRIDVDTTSF